MRRWLWATTCAILGCFNEGDTFVTDDSATTGPTSDTSASSGPEVTSAGSASSDPTETVGPETDTSTSGSTGVADTTADESSSTGVVPTWCDQQGGEILVCHDFDDAVPFLGANLWQDNGTVAVSDAQSVSAPQSMRVEVVPHASEPSNASMGQQLSGATLPFDGVLATRMWIEPECFAAAAGSVERLAVALQYADDTDPDGPFLFNTSVWFTESQVTYYESDQPQGYPSTGHSFAIALATGTWHELTLARAAQGTSATLVIDGVPHDIALTLATQTVLDQISDIVPAIAVGTTMAENQPGCTMYFDDVIVTE